MKWQRNFKCVKWADERTSEPLCDIVAMFEGRNVTVSKKRSFPVYPALKYGVVNSILKCRQTSEIVDNKHPNFFYK